MNTVCISRTGLKCIRLRRCMCHLRPAAGDGRQGDSGEGAVDDRVTRVEGARALYAVSFSRMSLCVHVANLQAIVVDCCRCGLLRRGTPDSVAAHVARCTFVARMCGARTHMSPAPFLLIKNFLRNSDVAGSDPKNWTGYSHPFSLNGKISNFMKKNIH